MYSARPAPWERRPSGLCWGTTTPRPCSQWAGGTWTSPRTLASTKSFFRPSTTWTKTKTPSTNSREVSTSRSSPSGQPGAPPGTLLRSRRSTSNTSLQRPGSPRPSVRIGIGVGVGTGIGIGLDRQALTHSLSHSLSLARSLARRTVAGTRQRAGRQRDHLGERHETVSRTAVRTQQRRGRSAGPGWCSPRPACAHTLPRPSLAPRALRLPLARSPGGEFWLHRGGYLCSVTSTTSARASHAHALHAHSRFAAFRLRGPD